MNEIRSLRPFLFNFLLHFGVMVGIAQTSSYFNTMDLSVSRDALTTNVSNLVNNTQGLGLGQIPVIINELDIDTPGINSQEFTELYDDGVRNTSTLVRGTSTPRAENVVIPPAPPTISILAARDANDGELVTISGVLTVSDQFGGSAYIQDATGGMAIFDEKVHGEGIFAVGDSITLTGTRSTFNEQVQLGMVIEVEDHGRPNLPILPQRILLSELAEFPGQLVRVVDVSFPRPGDILFGNSNYTLSDSSGEGELRIDNEVSVLVGLGQPEECREVVGVVGRFLGTFQLWPRFREDLACAGPYVPPGSEIDLDKAETLDVVTWNIEWFGDEENSPAAGNPMSDPIQRDSVRRVLKELDADIIAVQEIVDVPLFAELVNSLDGHDYILSPATSRPDATDGLQQKVGFIYKSATVSVNETRPLLESIHPLYNGGDTFALTDYPVEDKTRFFASGRLPFLMNADITIDGETEEFDIVALHARANSGSAARERYDMRKFDVEALKDSLDAQFSDSNLILLGDFNDDVDATVADISETESSYEAYVNDTENYNIISRSLSDEGFRSFVSRENMIDHIVVSDEMAPTYIQGTVSVGYEFYDNDYTRTVSDHFPVSARFDLEGFDTDGNPTIIGPVVKVFPNPFVDHLFADISVPKKSKIRFLAYDQCGRLVSWKNVNVKPGNTLMKIKLKQARRGFYIVRIFINGEFYDTQKLIKK